MKLQLTMVYNNSPIRGTYPGTPSGTRPGTFDRPKQNNASHRSNSQKFKEKQERLRPKRRLDITLPRAILCM